MEDISAAHYAVGNVSEWMAGLTAMGKLTTMNEIGEVLKQLQQNQLDLQERMEKKG